MIWIGGALVVLKVAAHAGGIRAGQVVIAVHVALGTLHAGMEAGQRESSGRVIESGAGPVGGAMTLLASLREP